MLKYFKILLYSLTTASLLTATIVFYVNRQIKKRGFENIEEIRLSGKLYIMSSDSIIEIDLERKKYEVKYSELPILIQWLEVISSNVFLCSENPSEKNIIRVDIRSGQKEKIGNGYPFSLFDKNLASFKHSHGEINLTLKNIITNKEYLITKVMKSSIPSFQWEQQFLTPVKFDKNSIMFMGDDLKIWIYSLSEERIIKKIDSKGLAPLFLRKSRQELLCRDVISGKYVWLNLESGNIYDSILPAEADYPIYTEGLNGVFFSARGFLERRDLFYLNLQNNKISKIYMNTGYSNGFWIQ